MKTVLIAEDDRVLRRRVAVGLKKAGGDDLAVVEVADGDEALEALKSDPADLVITDINMPRVSGLMVVPVSLTVSTIGWLTSSFKTMFSASKLYIFSVTVPPQ